jgi:hypothetical protein
VISKRAPLCDALGQSEVTTEQASPRLSPDSSDSGNLGTGAHFSGKPGAPSFASVKGGDFAAGDLCGSGKIVPPEMAERIRTREILGMRAQRAT